MGIDMNTALDTFVVLAAGVLAVLSVFAAAIAVAGSVGNRDGCRDRTTPDI